MKRSKRQEIEALIQEGKSNKEIAALGYSYGYTAAIRWDLKNPGALARNMAKWAKSPKGKEAIERSRRVWRRSSACKKVRLKDHLNNMAMHHNLTRPAARNHCQRWTMREIKYLETFGREKSMHQLALDLGRTYVAVQTAGHKFGIDLHGEKVGRGSARFKGIYRIFSPDALLVVATAEN